MDCAKEAQSQACNGVGSDLVWNNLRDPRNTNQTASEMSCPLEMLPGWPPGHFYGHGLMVCGRKAECPWRAIAALETATSVWRKINPTPLISIRVPSEKCEP
jgi:hypothetical protein